MKRPDYLEAVHRAEGITRIPDTVLVLRLSGSYMPYYWLPFHVLGYAEEVSHLRVFKKNPGLRRIYEMYRGDKASYIVISGRREMSVTPRSLFFYLASRAPSMAAVVRILLRGSERCVSHRSTVKTALRRMYSRRSGHIPVCKRGRIVYVATAKALALYLEEGGHTTTPLSALKDEYLIEPPRAADMPTFLNILRRFSHGVYAPSPTREIYVSESGLYSAARLLLA